MEILNLHPEPKFRIENQPMKLPFPKVQNLGKEINDIDGKKAQEAAKEFESFFMYLVLKEMRKAMLEGLESDESKMDFGGDILGDLGYMELTNQLSKSGSGIGIANLIYMHLSGEDLKKVLDLSNRKELDVPIETLGRTTPNVRPNSNFQVNKNYLKNSHSRLKEYEDYIIEAAKKFELSPELIKSVILAESNANPFAVSKAGAKGLMQLIDSTANFVGINNPFEPRQNILGGSRYLRQLLDTFDGNLDLALAAYNAGPGNVVKYNGIPPFPETRSYVARVKSLYKQISSKTLLEDANE